jgi:hypothetical protein
MEALLKDDNLRLFIEMRSQETPDLSTRLDGLRARIALGLLPYTWYNKRDHLLTIDFTRNENRTTQSLQLYSHRDAGQKGEMWLARFAFDPVVGHMCLESQEGAYQFLVKCVESISGIKFGGSKDRKRWKQPKTPSQSTEVVAQADLAAEVEQAPYRVPSALNFEHLQVFIAGRLSVAEDHIWTLREDPSYFQDTAQAYEQHQRQNLHTAQSGPAPNNNKSTWA